MIEKDEFAILRRRQAQVYLSALVSILVVLLATWIFDAVGTDTPSGKTAMMFIYLAIIVVPFVKLERTGCPNCGNKFFEKGPWIKFWTTRCLHCGISIFSSSSRNPPEP